MRLDDPAHRAYAPAATAASMSGAARLVLAAMPLFASGCLLEGATRGIAASLNLRALSVPPWPPPPGRGVPTERQRRR
jgi:hypothetical protein